jgi:hypothetical protein
MPKGIKVKLKFKQIADNFQNKCNTIYFQSTVADDAGKTEARVNNSISFKLKK